MQAWPLRRWVSSRYVSDLRTRREWLSSGLAEAEAEARVDGAGEQVRSVDSSRTVEGHTQGYDERREQRERCGSLHDRRLCTRSG